MPKITAHAKILRDWDALLGAVDANASLLPGVDDLKAGLEKLLADGRAAKVQQASLGSSRQAETQNVNQIMTDGQEAARKLRAFVFSHLGSKTDLVKQFGLPVPRKAKKKAESSVPDTPAPANPAGPEAHQAAAPPSVSAPGQGPSRNPTAP
jgi:hypothetical protein